MRMHSKIIILFMLAIFTIGFFLIGEIESSEFKYRSLSGKGRILVKGAPIHGANGLMFDSEDRLHIASVFGIEIVIMNPRNGRILDSYGPDKGVTGPDDLTFGPDGSLYWTDIFTGEIGRLSPDGITTKQMVAPGVNPITFSEDGRLFVALDFFGDALYEIDPELTQPPTLIAENLGFLNGMDFGPDGYLYGPIVTQGRLVRIDVDAVPFEMVTVSDGFVSPTAVKFDSRGRLHAVDAGTGDIVKINIENGDKEIIATTPGGLDNLAFDSRDRLYVSNLEDGSILRVYRNGKTRRISKGGMILPAGVAVMSNNGGPESVFVADNWTLREFNGRNGRLLSVDNYGWGVPGTLTTPLTVSTHGDMLIISSMEAVQVYDPEAGLAVEEYFDFMVPMNAIAFQGDIVVAELMTGNVVRQSDRSVLAGGLTVPIGLAATENELWVSDWATGTVWQIVPTDPSQNFEVAMGLSNPEGLAIDTKGNLLVVESGSGELSRINLENGEVDVLATNLDFDLGPYPPIFFPPSGNFNGVTVGSRGHIYVTAIGSNVIYKFRDYGDDDDDDDD